MILDTDGRALPGAGGGRVPPLGLPHRAAPAEHRAARIAVRARARTTSPAAVPASAWATSVCRTGEVPVPGSVRERGVAVCAARAPT
ncbi:hypothetical protein [Streptomyces sp.]|uniref:hypothetical protein n=1 Tax=Streptomyces sp. TaxID=1931 RepID=UPI002D5F16CC|nr:hypothetical protein [Streptomyces sp.]HZF88414.1 hypothetical protein [Streptomyces sp.]